MKSANILFFFIGLTLCISCNSNNEALERGMSELQNKEYEKAIISFKKGLENEPEQTELYHYGLANCYYYLEEYKSAEGHLSQTISIDNNHRDSYWLMARIFSKNNELNKSLGYYSKAISINSNSMLFASRGLIYLRMGEYGLALTDLDRAIEQNPNDQYALSNRGLVKVKLNMLNEASVDLQKSLQIDKDNPYAYKHFAILNLAHQDTTEACRNLQLSKEKGYFTFGNEIDKNEVNDLLKLYCK